MVSVGPKNVLALAAIFGLSTVAAVQHSTISKLQSQRPFLPSDEKAIGLAMKTLQEETGATSEDVARNRFPVVIRFGGVRCVSLKVPLNQLGSTRTYCFDTEYRRVRVVDTEAAEVIDTRPDSRISELLNWVGDPTARQHRTLPPLKA